MQQLNQIDGTLSTIEMQREALEDANQNTATITTMKKAAEVLKIAHQNLYVLLHDFKIFSYKNEIKCVLLKGYG